MRTKACEMSIGERRWMTKSQAMAWLQICEEVFDREWKGKLHVYSNGSRAAIYDRLQIDRLMERRIEIKRIL